MKIKSNFFYFIISILGLLVVLIFTIYQSQVNVPKNQQNQELIIVFNKVVYGLGQSINFVASLTPDYQKEINKPKLVQVFNNPLKNTFKFVKNVNVDKGVPRENLSDSLAVQSETLAYKELLRKKGFFVYKQGSGICVGWENSSGKRFSFVLPYK